MSKWNTTKLITAGSLGVLYLVLTLPGAVIQAAAGATQITGVSNGLVCGFMFAISCLIVRKFWAATIMGFVYGILALPFPLLVGAGFAPKIAIGAGIGLVADSLFRLLRKRDFLASIIVSLGSLWALGGLMFGFILLFSVPAPAAPKVIELWFSPIGLIGLNAIGIIPGVVAYFVYKKLENTAIVKRIQA